MTRRYPLVSVLFLVSGATGLLYEVAFSKLLAYVFGATAYAVSTVLASFMAGLALGAHLGGKHAARARRPLVVYGVLEIAVGLVCAGSPALLGALTDVYVGLARAAPASLAVLTVVRAALTAGIVVVPTVAMGATLPVLSRVVAGLGGDDAKRLSRLYAVNTAGGAAGALLGAYAVLPALGVRGTMLGAALANVAIGVVALSAGRRDPEYAPTTGPRSAYRENAIEAPNGGALDLRRILGLAFMSGFLVFAAEVVETHLLAMLIGNSAYAFGLMLAVFLVCLALGAARSASFARRHGDGALGRGLAMAALAVAATLPLWDQLPRIFLLAGNHVTSFGGREVCRGVAALAILAWPTYWMGTTFPLLLTQVAARPDVAALVGRLTVANTVGTIFGSIVTGYFVLPHVGSQGVLRAVAVAFALAALSTRPRPAGARFPSAITLVAGVGVAFALLAPRWDLERMTNGANVYFALTRPPPDAIEMVSEDVHGGVTTVTRNDNVHTLLTNGKFQGDDGPEMDAQRRFAHFPSLFVDHFDRALVIGLGTGTTLGTISTYPWKRIDVVEISPSIVEASRRFFVGPTGGALEDPRVVLSLNDGRNHLLVANAPYDLVTIELSSVWFAGASNLYSREFYDLVRSRLSDTGVLQQWVQLHHIRRQELAVVIRTLRGAFPHVALFVGGAQGILVASARPLVASRGGLEALEARPSLAATLGGKHLRDLLGELVASEADLDRFVEESEGPALQSTDDNLYLEYATPKGNVFTYQDSIASRLGELDAYRTSDTEDRHLSGEH